MISREVLSGHNSQVADKARFLDSSHLREDLKLIPTKFESLAEELLMILPSSPETTLLMQKLVEAKDQAVRAKIYGDEHNL
jgi:hypothetical protein